MNPVLVGVLGYVLLQFAIGAWVSRRIFTERDYINVGRQLGLGIASFSVFATWFGAEAIVGTAGIVYSDGLVGGTLYLAVGLIPVFLGLVGPALLPGLDEPEQLVPTLAQQYLPTLLYVIFAGAMISAILSTVDWVLLSGGSVLSHNLLASLRPGMSEAARVRAARICIVLLGLVAFAIALRSATIHELVETASSIGSSGLIVVALFGLFTRFGGPAAAIAALLAGAVVLLAGIAFSLTNVPYVLAVGMATLAYAAAGFLSRNSPG